MEQIYKQKQRTKRADDDAGLSEPSESLSEELLVTTDELIAAIDELLQEV